MLSVIDYEMTLLGVLMMKELQCKLTLSSYTKLAADKVSKTEIMYALL